MTKRPDDEAEHLPPDDEGADDEHEDEATTPLGPEPEKPTD